MRRFLSAITALILAIMNLFGVQSVSTRESGMIIYDDIAYGVGENQSIDMYLPENCGDETGLFVFLHAGSWRIGAKENYNDKMKEYTLKYGIATVSIGYRFISDDNLVTAESIMSDISQGLSLAKKLAEERGIKIKASAIEGSSAGGYNALLYAYKYGGQSPVPIKFVASYAGPTMLFDDNYYVGTEIFTKSQAYRLFGSLCGVRPITDCTLHTLIVQYALKKASPITYVTSKSPVTVLLYGNTDQAVPYSNATALKEALDKCGVESYLFTAINAGHGIFEYDEETTMYNNEIYRQLNEKNEELINLYLK